MTIKIKSVNKTAYHPTEFAFFVFDCLHYSDDPNKGHIGSLRATAGARSARRLLRRLLRVYHTVKVSGVLYDHYPAVMRGEYGRLKMLDLSYPLAVGTSEHNYPTDLVWEQPIEDTALERRMVAIERSRT